MMDTVTRRRTHTDTDQQTQADRHGQMHKLRRTHTDADFQQTEKNRRTE